MKAFGTKTNLTQAQKELNVKAILQTEQTETPISIDLPEAAWFQRKRISLTIISKIYEKEIVATLPNKLSCSVSSNSINLSTALTALQLLCEPAMVKV